MRRILITDSLRKEVKEFNDTLFIKLRSSTFELPITRLQKLQKKFTGNRYKKNVDYIQMIIDDYTDILNADPVQMKAFINKFKAFNNTFLSKKIYGKEFYKYIVEAMRYEDLRDKEFPFFLLSSSLRTCVYCNAQSTIVIEKQFFDQKKRRVKSYQAKLQLDHFFPKSIYPFLCTSFFNLYPTCGNCNIAKSDKNALFQLYTNSLKEVDVFNFKVDDISILEYFKTFNSDTIEVYFETTKGDLKLLDNHNELFQTQAVYSCYKDVAQELLVKARANPQSYRNVLQKEFHKLFSDSSIIDRILVGNYTDPEDIFKRPLSKYSQDIARQLKLIP